MQLLCLFANVNMRETIVVLTAQYAEKIATQEWWETCLITLIIR